MATTKIEDRRRQEMRVRNVRYGFFRVAKDEITLLVCSKCGKNIYGQVLIINGVASHYQPCV